MAESGADDFEGSSPRFPLALCVLARPCSAAVGGELLAGIAGPAGFFLLRLELGAIHGAAIALDQLVRGPMPCMVRLGTSLQLRSDVTAMIRMALFALLGGALGAGAMALWAKRVEGRESPSLAERIRQIAPTAAAVVSAPRVMRTIYLNREGARLKAGVDDSKKNVSSIVQAASIPEVTIPAFDGAHARWQAIVQCLRQKFAAFDVSITDQRPVEGDYVMAVFGGRAKVLGDGEGVHAHGDALGLSPYDGKPIEDAVVLVFTDAMNEQLKLTCEAAAMEIAHAYGLDHARHCGDLMTYLPPCGLRRFVDKDLRCGEHQERDCGNGKRTQNSYMELLELLGPRRL